MRATSDTFAISIPGQPAPPATDPPTTVDELEALVAALGSDLRAIANRLDAVLENFPEVSNPRLQPRIVEARNRARIGLERIS